MNPFDAERVRIRRELDAGEMTASEHRRIARAIDRAQKSEALSEVRHERKLAATRTCKRQQKLAREHLRQQLVASQEIWS